VVNRRLLEGRSLMTITHGPVGWGQAFGSSRDINSAVLSSLYPCFSDVE